MRIRAVRPFTLGPGSRYMSRASGETSEALPSGVEPLERKGRAGAVSHEALDALAVVLARPRVGQLMATAKIREDGPSANRSLVGARSSSSPDSWRYSLSLCS